MESLKSYLEITPIEEHNGILFKRDDYYQPYADIPINGGKVRQCYCLFFYNAPEIWSRYGGVVVTAGGVHSPQSLIVTRVAKDFGFKVIVGVGNNDKNAPLAPILERHKLLAKAHALGATIKLVTNGANKIIENEVRKMEGFPVLFGINLKDNPKAIIQSTSDQVQNLPKDLDNLVIPVGSGIIMGGILKGLAEYKIRPKRIIGIHIAGYNRTKTINEICQFDVTDLDRPTYEYVEDATFPYSKQIKIEWGGITLDPIYEAKAFIAMQKMDLKGKTLFWIVGNSTAVRS